MRSLLFFLITIATLGVSAQSALTVRLLDSGEREARTGNFEAGAKDISAALRSASVDGSGDPFIARVRYDLGVCRFRLGQNAAAATDLEEALHLVHGNYPRASYALGMVHLEQQEWAKARRAFLKVVDANGSDGEVWFDLGVAYLGENDLRGAENAFQNSVRFGTRDASLGHNNIGVILAVSGDLSAALKEFETALTLSAGSLREARSNLEYCRSLMHDRPALIAKLEFGRRGLSGLLKGEIDE